MFVVKFTLTPKKELFLLFSNNFAARSLSLGYIGGVSRTFFGTRHLTQVYSQLKLNYGRDSFLKPSKRLYSLLVKLLQKFESLYGLDDCGDYRSQRRIKYICNKTAICTIQMKNSKLCTVKS